MTRRIFKYQILNFDFILFFSVWEVQTTGCSRLTNHPLVQGFSRPHSTWTAPPRTPSSNSQQAMLASDAFNSTIPCSVCYQYTYYIKTCCSVCMIHWPGFQDGKKKSELEDKSQALSSVDSTGSRLSFTVSLNVYSGETGGGKIMLQFIYNI